MDTNTQSDHLLAPDGSQPAPMPRTQPRSESEASTPDPAPTSVLGGAVVGVIVGSAILRLALAAFVTHFVLVDDAYIHLRYARNLWTTGDFVYNAGEPVFGLTSPLFGLLCTVLYGLFGSHVAIAVTTLNVALWTGVSVLAARTLPASVRLPLIALICLAPVFVDNQLLGMESALFALVLMGSLGCALSGRTSNAAAWYGIALITRPEAVLLAPVLLWAASRREGLHAAVRNLVQPRTLMLLVGPGILWCVHAMNTYGTIVPQSMVAKTGWNNDHYDGLFGLKGALLAVPRLTLIPFVDYFPGAVAWSLTAGVIASVGYVIRANVSRGNATSRAWLGFYLIYVAFYVAGKGATEASWYAVPSSLAFLMAAMPALPAWTRKPAVGWAFVVGLAGVSFVAAQKRAPLLQSYVDGYGKSALYLENMRNDEKVVIGEIGIFGFHSSHPVVDVGALVSPEVLPWKNDGFSFCRIVQESGARWFVISDVAVESNAYPSVGQVWSDDTERAWFEACTHVAQHADKRTYAIPAEHRD